MGSGQSRVVTSLREDTAQAIQPVVDLRKPFSHENSLFGFSKWRHSGRQTFDLWNRVASQNGGDFSAIFRTSTGYKNSRIWPNPNIFFEEILTKAWRFFRQKKTKLGVRCTLMLPHTSWFFVVELQIFCRDQIGLKFDGTSACHTLTMFRVDFSFDLHHVGKKACSHDSHDNFLLVKVHASPDKLFCPLHTSQQRPTRRFEI